MSHHLIIMTEILSHNNDIVFFHIYDLIFLCISGYSFGCSSDEVSVYLRSKNSDFTLL